MTLYDYSEMEAEAFEAAREAARIQRERDEADALLQIGQWVMDTHLETHSHTHTYPPRTVSLTFKLSFLCT